ncbi:MAG: hypothetical protein WC642_01465 [Nocardioides sp.]|jgi:hypothetical protein
MVTGPQQMRLEQALAGASETALHGAGREWQRCSELLGRVADALDRAALAEKSVGGQTGPAMATAFRTSATGMRAKQDEIMKGMVALGLAADAVEAARATHINMDKDHPLKPNPGPYRPPPGPNDGEDLPLRAAHQVKVGKYEQSLLDREEAARKAADDLDTEYARATDKMKQIHGIPDPVQPPESPQGPSGPPAGATPPPGGRTPLPTPGVHTVGTSSVHTVHPTTHHTHPTTSETHNPTTTTVPPVFDPTQPTVTQPVPDPVTTSSTPGSTGVTGGAGGVSAPLAGGLGVVAGGGLAGAAISGIRGGFAPASAAAGAPARPIGSTTRAGAPGALGRGGAAGAGSPTSRPTGGRGTGGRGGAAGAGGGAGGRGSRRSGAAAAGGAAAGRRGGKKDQGEQGRDRDLFDDGQEWIDDAEAAPGVID